MVDMKLFQSILMIGFVAGVAVYYALLLGSALFPNKLTGIREGLSKNSRVTIWLPNILIGSFAFVSIFYERYEPKEQAGGELTLEFFDLTLSGPSGPVMLWVVTYLTIVSSIGIVERKAGG